MFKAMNSIRGQNFKNVPEVVEVAKTPLEARALSKSYPSTLERIDETPKTTEKSEKPNVTRSDPRSPRQEPYEAVRPQERHPLERIPTIRPQPRTDSRRGSGRGKGEWKRDHRGSESEGRTFKLLTNRVSTIGSSGRNQSVRSTQVGGMHISRPERATAQREKEWRMISQDDVNLLCNDSKTILTTDPDRVLPEVVGMVRKIVRDSGMQPFSDKRILDKYQDEIREILAVEARARASDVKVRNPIPNSALHDDPFCNMFLPEHAVPEYSYPTINSPVRAMFVTEYSDDADFAVYQKWVQSHVWYTPLGFPYVPKFLGSKREIEPYTLNIKDNDGLVTHVNINRNGGLDVDAEFELEKQAAVIEAAQMESVIKAVIQTLNS
jgi:hypothetical protein